MLDGLLVLLSCQQGHDGWRDGYAKLQAADLYEVLWQCGLLRKCSALLSVSTT